jgi:hypothetical protein
MVCRTHVFWGLQSKNVDLSQRCKEFEALLARPSLMIDVLPVDASCEDIEVAFRLPHACCTFLQVFVFLSLLSWRDRWMNGCRS